MSCEDRIIRYEERVGKSKPLNAAGDLLNLLPAVSAAIPIVRAQLRQLPKYYLLPHITPSSSLFVCLLRVARDVCWGKNESGTN